MAKKKGLRYNLSKKGRYEYALYFRDHHDKAHHLGYYSKNPKIRKKAREDWKKYKKRMLGK